VFLCHGVLEGGLNIIIVSSFIPTYKPNPLDKKKYINPKLAPFIHKELQKMIKPQIISPTRHSSWVAKLVPIINKNG
jgi:hypothetical protein